MQCEQQAHLMGLRRSNIRHSVSQAIGHNSVAFGDAAAKGHHCDNGGNGNGCGQLDAQWPEEHLVYMRTELLYPVT